MNNNAPSRPPLWKRVAANSLLLLVSFLFAAAVGEVVVRIAAPQQLILIRPDVWEPADTIGWLRRPNVDASINTGERTIRVFTDEDGFRVGERGRTNGLPILLLGDSFLEALQVEYEQSFAGLLQASVSEAIGTQAAVRNAAVSDWDPGQYLARARQLLPQEDYQVVVVGVFVGNDIRPLQPEYTPPRAPAERFRFRLPNALTKKELISSTLHPINDALEVRSHLFVLLRAQLEPLRRKAGLSAHYFPPEFLKSEAASERWSVTADVLNQIAALAESQGARTLFVLIPPDFQVDPASFDAHVRGFGINPGDVDLEQPTRILTRELENRQLHVVDALPFFRSRHEAGEQLYGRIDIHLSPAGNAALAELVSPVVARLLTDATAQRSSSATE